MWLDLPVHVWLPRLIRRTARRILRREEIWNGNRERLKGAIGGKRRAHPLRLRMHRSRGAGPIPPGSAAFPVVRLRTQAEVDAFVSSTGGP